ncbi:hypothetical protein EON63_05815 [archaeon]|nr:MAG: hypothetical protein EON63_05815 [archaeon]
MYDLGFPPDLQRSIANKFNTSVHASHLVSYRPPRRVMEEYGYSVKFVYSVNTSMFGKLCCSVGARIVYTSPKRIFNTYSSSIYHNTLHITRYS